MSRSDVETAGIAGAAERLERGRALREQNRPEAAVAEFHAAIALEPTWADAHHQLGNALKSLRRYAEAATSLRRAAELAPDEAAIWLNLGVACLEIRRYEETIGSFRSALRLEPERPEAHNILGHALLAAGRCTEARRSLEEALRLRPGYAAAHDNMGRVLKAEGRAVEAIEHHRAALRGQPRPETHSNLLYSLNFVPGRAEAEIAAEHRRWAQVYEGSLRTSEPLVPTSKGGRLRVGYVSPDFVGHSVAYFIEPVLAAHDRAGFEVFCYSDAPVPDSVTLRLRARTEHWRDIAGWSDDRVDALVREDRIDILVDLAGHTARNRLLVFARRPAPVQITWLGYPNTTGLSAIDYRLTDAVSDPVGATEAWHSEELVRLPETFSCYRPPEESPPVGAAPSLTEGHVTFGCFNNFAKVSRPTIELWARILRETPGSRLLLKSRGLADAGTATRVWGEFGAAGVAPERIEFDGEELSVARHLRLYQRVDVALDPFPYNGATTTCEALWMGVPVVTLAGEAHRSRVGASLLTRLGRPEWIAGSPDDYAAIAQKLASDPAALAPIRRGQRERMRTSPICDGPRFTRQLENAFRQMGKRRLPNVPAAP